MFIIIWILKIVNFVFAALLALAFFSSNYAFEAIPFISILSLFTPALIIINLFFVIGWIIARKMLFLYSVIALSLGFNQYDHFFGGNFNSEEHKEGDLKIISYNVRLFNWGNWIKDKNIPSKIHSQVTLEDPDILCFQEYSPNQLDFSNWKYKYIIYRDIKQNCGLAIFSKYPIINSGSLDFSNTVNNAIFADIEIAENNIIRVYNSHLQSIRITGNELEKVTSTEGEERKNTLKKLILQLDSSFLIQNVQSQKLRTSVDSCKYPIVICSDFNNTPFSYPFKCVSGDNFLDNFAEAGNGMGRSFRGIKFYPLRIDFILSDKKHFKVTSFKTINSEFSDHNPICSTVRQIL